jgi:hypothetical protein
MKARFPAWAKYGTNKAVGDATGMEMVQLEFEVEGQGRVPLTVQIEGPDEDVQRIVDRGLAAFVQSDDDGSKTITWFDPEKLPVFDQPDDVEVLFGNVVCGLLIGDTPLGNASGDMVRGTLDESGLGSEDEVAEEDTTLTQDQVERIHSAHDRAILAVGDLLDALTGKGMAEAREHALRASKALSDSGDALPAK